MSERIRQIAREAARESSHLTSHPKLSALHALRGDLSALEREILEETASALGSSARRLEASLAALAKLDRELNEQEARASEAQASNAQGAASHEEARRALVERFNAQREHAMLRLHYVCIQREALGFFHHEELDRYYPVPPKRK